MPILRFHDPAKGFGGQVVLDGITGEIRPGEIVLLRGENGSGKTTLLNILTGCLEPDRGTIEIAHPNGIGIESFASPRPCHRDLNLFQRFRPQRVARLGISRTWQNVHLFPSLDLTQWRAAPATTRLALANSAIACRDFESGREDEQ